MSKTHTTYYCPNCRRYLIRYGDYFECHACEIAAEMDPGIVWRWHHSVVTARYSEREDSEQSQTAADQ
jgi:hypothetical protein